MQIYMEETKKIVPLNPWRFAYSTEHWHCNKSSKFIIRSSTVFPNSLRFIVFLQNFNSSLGLYAAAHNHGIEWLVIKGVSDFGDDNKSGNDSWRPFASVMAASLVAHMLNDSIAFEKWRHYEGK